METLPRYNRLKEGKQLDWLPILLSGIAGPYKCIHSLLSNNQLHVFPRLNENSRPRFLVVLFSLISFHLADLALLLTNYLVHHLCVKWVNPSCTFHLLIMSRNTRFISFRKLWNFTCYTVIHYSGMISQHHCTLRAAVNWEYLKQPLTVPIRSSIQLLGAVARRELGCLF